MTQEEASILKSLAEAAQLAGSNAIAMGVAQEPMEQAAKDAAAPKAYKMFVDGAFEGALTGHSVVSGLFQQAAEEMRTKYPPPKPGG